MAYTYKVTLRETGQFYYGVRYSKRSNGDDLWKKYFTSSKVVKFLIEEHGIDAFDVEILERFEDAESAVERESLLIKEHINDPLNLNMHYGNVIVYKPESRKIPDSDGLTSYKRAATKVVETKRNDVIDGLDVYQRSYAKALVNDPLLTQKRTDAARMTRADVGDDGLTRSQRGGLKIRGENNPAKKPENTKKISDGIKRYVKENPEKAKAKQDYINYVVKYIPDENGLTSHDRHSIYMTENNPASGTIWINDGVENIRLPKDQEIPYGFVKGRMKLNRMKEFERVTCPYCNTQGGGGNMVRFHFDNCKKKV